MSTNIINTIGVAGMLVERLRDNSYDIINHLDSLSFCTCISNYKSKAFIIDEEELDIDLFVLVGAIKQNIISENIPIIIISTIPKNIDLFKIVKYKIYKVIKKDATLLENLKIIMSNIKNKEDYINENIIQIGKFNWNKELSILTNNKKEFYLTFHETKFLSLLIDSPNRVLTKENLFYELYYDEEKEYNDFTLRNLIKNIRKKTSCKNLMTIYGIGYKIKV